MNPKYQKVLSDIEKAEKKKSEIEGQLKELYDKKTELENLEIINTVRSMVMDKDQIMACLLYTSHHAAAKTHLSSRRQRVCPAASPASHAGCRSQVLHRL